MTHNQEEILKKIVSLKKEYEEITSQLNKQSQAIFGLEEIDYNSIVLQSRGWGKKAFQRLNEIKPLIVELVEQLNNELGIDWEGNPTKDLFENLNNIEIKKIKNE